MATLLRFEVSHVADSRKTVRSDVLWDGSKLYVATHVFSELPATGSPSNLYRFSDDDTRLDWHDWRPLTK